MPDWVTNNLEGVFSAAAVGVIGAVIAGFSAWLKTWFVSRDDKTRAAEQLQLASKRTEFAVQWLAAKRAIAEDETTPEDVKVRAQHELDAAYQNARNGFAEGGIAISDASYEQVVDQLKAILLLRSGYRTTSKWLVACFYVCVFGLAAVMGVQENVACDATTVEVPLERAADTESAGGVAATESEEQVPVSTAAPAATPLEIVVDGPARVVSGREATYTIRVSGTGTETLQSVTGRFGTTDNVQFTPPDTSESTAATRPTRNEGVFEWTTTDDPVSGSIAYSVTVVVVAEQGTELEYLADVRSTTDTTAEQITATATARTSVTAPCVQYRFVPNGWAWFFGAAAGTAFLRLFFGWLVARNEGRRGDTPSATSNTEPDDRGA